MEQPKWFELYPDLDTEEFRKFFEEVMESLEALEEARWAKE